VDDPVQFRIGVTLLADFLDGMEYGGVVFASKRPANLR
jgi:hypothetical protein